MATEFLVLNANPRKALLDYGAKRGDLVSLEDQGDGELWIFDGVDIVRLDYDIWEGGALPRQFTSDDFDLDHWRGPRKVILRDGVPPENAGMGKGFGEIRFAHMVATEKHKKQWDTLSEWMPIEFVIRGKKVTVDYDSASTFTNGLVTLANRGDGWYIHSKK
jgi:hypothetical protein